MEKFPILNENQVALVRTLAQTGQVIDENFILAKRHIDSQKVYTVFESLDLAIEAAKKELLKRNDIQVFICGKNEKPLHYIDSKISKKWEPFPP